MIGKMGGFLFGQWGGLAAALAGLAMLFGVWKIDRYVYGVSKLNAGVAQERDGNTRKATDNVDKANRARIRSRSDNVKRLRASPYVRRQR